MPVQTFNFFSSGRTAEQRQFQDYTVDTDLDDDRLWVPFAPGSFFQPCQFNTTSGWLHRIVKSDARCTDTFPLPSEFSCRL